MEEDDYTQKSDYGTHLKGFTGRVMGMEGTAIWQGLEQGDNKRSHFGHRRPLTQAQKEPASIQPLESRKATDSWLTPSPHCLCTGAGRAGGRGSGGDFPSPWL